MTDIQNALAAIKNLEKKGDFTTLEFLQDRIQGAIIRTKHMGRKSAKPNPLTLP